MTYVNETTELVHVFVSGEEIITTPRHPVYSPVKGWTSAAQLRTGDILVLVNGEYVVVAGVDTYLGTKLPVFTDTAFTAGFTSFSGGLYMGAQTEIVNVATQTLISKAFNEKPRVKAMDGRVISSQYAHKFVRPYPLQY